MTRSHSARLVVGTVACIAGLVISQAPAHAVVPLPAPANVSAVHVSDTAADLLWLSSGLADQDVVQRQVGGVWHDYAGGLHGSLALTGLAPATTYIFRVYSIPVDGLGYTISPPSSSVTFTTLAGPDRVAPSAPPAPTFGGVTTTAANVSWGEAVDNVQVTGYRLQELTSGGWVTYRTVGAAERFQWVYGLAPATSYTFAVVAFDAAGNTSPRSDPATVTTLPTTAAPVCRVKASTFNPGFVDTVTIVNSTAAALSGWRVEVTLPSGTVISSVTNAVLSRTGTLGTITPASYDIVIGPGMQLFISVMGTSVPFMPPFGFALNGLPCPIE